MRAPRKSVSAYLSALFLAALALAILGVDDPAPAQPPAPLGGVPDLTGTWEGAWHDTVFDALGPMTLDLAQDATTFSLTGTNDLMNYFGSPFTATEPLEGSGSITAGGTLLSASYEFTAMSTLTGSGNFVIAGSGSNNMTGAGNTGDPLFYGNYQFILTATETDISGTFFGFASGGAGTIQLTRTSDVDRDSWAAIKEMYRE